MCDSVNAIALRRGWGSIWRADSSACGTILNPLKNIPTSDSASHRGKTHCIPFVMKSWNLKCVSATSHCLPACLTSGPACKTLIGSVLSVFLCRSVNTRLWWEVRVRSVSINHSKCLDVYLYFVIFVLLNSTDRVANCLEAIEEYNLLLWSKTSLSSLFLSFLFLCLAPLSLLSTFLPLCCPLPWNVTLWVISYPSHPKRGMSEEFDCEGVS